MKGSRLGLRNIEFQSAPRALAHNAMGPEILSWIG
jgi:hypothetical protein